MKHACHRSKVAPQQQLVCQAHLRFPAVSRPSCLQSSRLQKQVHTSLLRQACTAAPTTCSTTRCQSLELKSRSLKTQTISISGVQQPSQTPKRSTAKSWRTRATTCLTSKASARLHTKLACHSLLTTLCQPRISFVQSSGVQTSWCIHSPSSSAVTERQSVEQSSTAEHSTSAKTTSSLTSPNQILHTTASHIGQRLAQVRTSSRHACKCCATWEWQQRQTTRSTSCKVLKHCRSVWIVTGPTHKKLASSLPSIRKLKKCFMPA